MKEHPDYKYRPRRKPKPLMKKELGRYAGLFPGMSGQGLDPINMNFLARQFLSPYPTFSSDKSRDFTPFPSPATSLSSLSQQRSPLIKEEEGGGGDCSPRHRSLTRSPDLSGRSRRSRSHSPDRSPSPDPATFSSKRHFLPDSPSHPDSTTSPAPLVVRPPSPPAPGLTLPPLSYPSLTNPPARLPLPISDLFHYLPPYQHLLSHYLPPYLLHSSGLQAMVAPPAPPPHPHIAIPIPKRPAVNIKTEPTELLIRPPAAQNSNF